MRLAASLLLASLSLPAWGAPPRSPGSPPGPGGGGPVVVGLEGASAAGTDLRVATDLSHVLSGPEMRVVPIVGQGSVRNLDDILHLRGVDVAVVQTDVMDLAERSHYLAPGLEQSVQYISKLFDEEIHVIAGPDIHTLADLKNKPVNADLPMSGSSLTAHVLFGLMNIPVTFTPDAQEVAIEKLKHGEVAALVRVTGKPADIFLALPPNAGLHLLPLPQDDARLLQTYAPGSIGHADYPNLVPDGAPPVATLTTGTVLAAYNWPRDSEHYRNVSLFVSALFAHIGDLQKPPAHPKWKEVNLSATVPNWTRLPVAAEAVQRAADAPAMEEFARYLAAGPAMADLKPQQREALLQQFVKWRRGERQ